jgi:UDPglucose 6-dehydrogenase
MNQKPIICIIGCGHVGLTTAAVLANCGFEVRAIEINPERLKIVQSGRSFFYEVGVDALLQSAFSKKSLTVTDAYEMAVPGSDIVFSCVGTPDNPDGSSNLSYIFDAAARAVALMKPDAIFAQKSTVPVGTGAKIERLFREAGRPIRYVSNPEFLRESTAIRDTLWFDRIVAGSDNNAAAEAVLNFCRTIEDCRDDISSIAQIKIPQSPPQTQYIRTTRNSAELIKVTANAFLALKISFANSIAKLAAQTDADIVEVMGAVGADPRIGRAFLNAGRGYGGGCFPKDVSGLIRSAEEYGVNLEVMGAAVEVNESMPHYILNEAAQAFGSGFSGHTVTVLGLAFKAGTSDVRRSPAINIANTLADQGAAVRVYDPQAATGAQPLLSTSIQICKTLQAALQNAACIFVATDWPEFIQFDWRDAASAKLIVDCLNCLDPQKVRIHGATYLGVGHK